MDRSAEILAEIKSMNGTMTKIQVSHGKLEERSDLQHTTVVKSIEGLTTQVGNQNGRVTSLELFKNTIMTKIKIIPATISVVIGGLVTAIGLYLRW
jgi:hypothetical protein